MNRRDTITALLAFGTEARAQSRPSGQVATIGVLAQAVSTTDLARSYMSKLRAELKALKWIEGQNLVIESAFGEGKGERLPALAEELVRKRVDVIWVGSEVAAVAAARATRTIPIVFTNVYWPVETGLIDSFARPGRNATGMSAYSGIEVSTKRLEFLKEIAPGAIRLSWMFDAVVPTVDGGNFDVRPLLESDAKKLGYETRYHLLAKSDDIDRAFAEMLDWRAQAIAVAGLAIFAAVGRIASFSVRNRLPSACLDSRMVDAGCLLSYNAAGSVLTESMARGVDYVDRILRGAHPRDLPVQRPDKYELVINLKTAKALGLRIPQSVLLRADRLVE